MKKNFILFLIVSVLAVVAILIMQNIKETRADTVKQIYNNIIEKASLIPTMPGNPAEDNNINNIPESDNVNEVEEKLVNSESTKIQDIEKDTNISDIEKDLEGLDNLDAELNNLF